MIISKDIRNSLPLDSWAYFSLSHVTVSLAHITPVEGAGIGSEVGISPDASTAIDAPEVGECSLVAILSGKAVMVRAVGIDLGEGCGRSDLFGASDVNAESDCGEAGYSEGLVHHYVRLFVSVLFLKLTENLAPFYSAVCPA